MACPFSYWFCVARFVVADHGAADGLAIRWPVEFGDDASAAHHADAIGQGQHLIKVFADHQHRCAGDDVLELLLRWMSGAIVSDQDVISKIRARQTWRNYELSM